MATVSLQIGDMLHEVACRDGGEARLEAAGAILDARWADVRRAIGNAPAQRTLLLAALMVADALIDAENKPPPETPESQALERIAARLEALADTLEQEASAS